MTKRYNLILNMDKLSRYATENAEYKDKARKLFVDWLGYEPDLRASWEAELMMRQSLKRVADGDLPEDKIPAHIEIFGRPIHVFMKDLNA